MNRHLSNYSREIKQKIYSYRFMQYKELWISTIDVPFVIFYPHVDLKDEIKEFGKLEKLHH